MKLHNFFISQQIGNSKNIKVCDADLVFQWRSVLRFKKGDWVRLLDNSQNEFIAEFVSLNKEDADFKIIKMIKSEHIPEKTIHLFQSLVKKDKMEWILEKCTELGVLHFTPIISERSEKKNFNLERAVKIIKEAAEQSGLGVLPQLHEVSDLEKVFDRNELNFIAFDPDGADFKMPKSPIGIMIGPEGGWSENEIELFKSRKIPIYNLGFKTVLRAETAAVVASAMCLRKF